MNAYQKGDRKVIPAVLIYAQTASEILMLYRNRNPEVDIHSGKWNGLGGKLEPGESPEQAAKREFYEEAKQDLPESAFHCCGVLHFPDFKHSKREDWTVFVMSVAVPEKWNLKDIQCPEGELHWVPKGELLNRPLWEGDRSFLPWVLEQRPFLGTFWYSPEGQLLKHVLREMVSPKRGLS